MRIALIVVDVQEGFLNKRNRWIVPNIVRTIREGRYDLIAEAIFHADPGSPWDTRLDWTFPLAPTVPEIAALLPADRITVVKTARSAFKGNQDLEKALRSRGIEEVHIVGIDTEDCVLATAFDAFEAGFSTFVLEDCTESSVSGELRDAGLALLREQKMHLRFRGS